MAEKKSPKSAAAAAAKRGKQAPAARAGEAADAPPFPSPGGDAAPLTSAPVVQPASAAPVFGASQAQQQQQGRGQMDARVEPDAVSGTAATASGHAASTSSSLQSLAQQQDEYRRKLQRQHELQQQQWQLRQASQIREQQMKMQEQAERQDRMQHIQQKLQERIQYKQQQQPVSTSAHATLTNSAALHQQQQQQQAAVLQMRQAIIRRKEKEMSQSLAEHQIQLYKAMMRDLELQSGIPMTSSMASPTLNLARHGAAIGNTAAHRAPGMHPQAGTLTSAAPAELTPAPIPTAELTPAPITTGMLPASTAKAYEDFQRARQEQLNRLQYMQLEKQQKLQHAASVAAPAQQPVSKPLSIATARDAAVVSEDAIRQQLLAEQERLRILQSREMEHHQQMQRRAPPMSSQEKLLLQQHDILRQQQMLQGLLHKQHLERQQQILQQQQTRQQMHAVQAQRLPQSQQPQQQQQLPQKKLPAKKTPPPPASTDSEAMPPPTKKRKKSQSTPESQMEALARELVRISSAKTAVEMRTSLDKMTAWVHRSFDTVLLRFAQRDFRDTIHVKRQTLTVANQWTTDIQVKSEYIAEKIAQIIAAFAAQQKGINVPPSVLGAQASNQTGSGSAASEREMEAREHAYKALKAQMMEKQQQKEKSAASAASKASGQSNAAAEKQKKPLFVDLSQMSSKSSTLAANATEAASTAKPNAPDRKTDAIPTTQVPMSAKSVSTPAAPLSPRVVQQLYEIDLSSRNCSITGDESEDKFYIPMKSISKVMRRALPGGETTATTATKSPAHAGSKDNNAAAQTTPVLEPSAEANDDHVGVAKSAPEKQELLPASADGETQEIGNGEQQAPAKTLTREAGDNADTAEAGGDEKAVSSAARAASTALSSSLLDESRPKTRSETAPKTAATVKQPATQVPGIKIDDDAVAFMQECVTEFILFLTSEAKDHCSLDKKKSTPLLGSHVVQGMSNLGFSTYAKVLDAYNSKLKKMQDAVNQKKLLEKKHRQQHRQLEALAAAKAAAAAASALQSSSGNAASNATESKVAAAAAGVALGVDASQSKQNPAAEPEAANGAVPAAKAAASNLPSENQGAHQAGVNTTAQ